MSERTRSKWGVLGFERGAGFVSVLGGDDFGALFSQDVGDGVADVGLVVGDEDAFAGEGLLGVCVGVGVGAEDGLGPGGDVADGVSDGFDAVDDAVEPAAHGVVADVLFEEALGLGDNVVEGLGHFLHDAVGDLAGGGAAFDDEEVEDAQGLGDGSGEDFGELAVVLGEGADASGLDVVDADDLVVEHERDGE